MTVVTETRRRQPEGFPTVRVEDVRARIDGFIGVVDPHAVGRMYKVNDGIAVSIKRSQGPDSVLSSPWGYKAVATSRGKPVAERFTSDDAGEHGLEVYYRLPGEYAGKPFALEVREYADGRTKIWFRQRGIGSREYIEKAVASLLKP